MDDPFGPHYIYGDLSAGGYTCSVCGRFVPPGQQHTCGFDVKAPVSYCPICGRKGGVRVAIRQTAQSNEPTIRVRLRCDFCGQGFYYQED